MKPLLTLLILLLLINYPTIAQDDKAREAGIENDYIKIQQSENSNEVILSFYIQNEPVFSIGENMYQINENAYMNGYNWGAFLANYLERKHPDILKGMKSDPEAGIYTAYYKLNRGNIVKAEQLAHIIISLIENPNSIYTFLKKEGDKIVWD